MQAVARAVSRRYNLAPAVIARGRTGIGMQRGYCNDPRHKHKIHQLEVLKEKIDILCEVDSWINYVPLIIGTYFTVEIVHYLYGNDRPMEAPACTTQIKAAQE